MTIAQNMRIAGFKASLRVRGRCMTTDGGDVVTVLVQDAPMLQDPDKPAQQKQPVYVMIFALAGAVADPRAIESFTDNAGQDNERVFKVFRYDETSGDAVAWKWFCEAQREDFSE